ncbi:MAG: SDR family oxidoreductase [Deltaproteobacteria bacterium]|nr:SDR family oxidoreductase [Deltaproteobacteria bacterium]
MCPGKIQTERVDEIDTARALRSGKTLDAVRSETFKEIPMGRFGTPQEFANTVVFLASECASYITGSTLQVDGGYIRTLW